MIRYKPFEGCIRSEVEPNIIKSETSLKIFSNDLVITSTFFKEKNITLRSDIHKLIKSIWNKRDNLNNGRDLLLYQLTRREVEMVSSYQDTSLLRTSHIVSSSILLSK
jgi:hypothetical protein